MVTQISQIIISETGEFTYVNDCERYVGVKGRWKHSWLLVRVPHCYVLVSTVSCAGGTLVSSLNIADSLLRLNN